MSSNQDLAVFYYPYPYMYRLSAHKLEYSHTHMGQTITYYNFFAKSPISSSYSTNQKLRHELGNVYQDSCGPKYVSRARGLISENSNKEVSKAYNYQTGVSFSDYCASFGPHRDCVLIPDQTHQSAFFFLMRMIKRRK